MEVNEHVMARPAPALRPFVAYYSGYRQRGLPPGTHRGLPSPWLTLIVTIGEPLVVAAHPDRRQAPGRYDALLGGLHVSPALITHDGFQSGVQVAVSPLGCRAFFGMPAAELANVDTDLAGVITGPVVDQVREQVITAATWPERFAAIDDTLLRLAARHDDRVPPEVARAFRRLVATGGDLPIADLAREVGWSARHLTARFRAELGLRPKETARVVRFERVRRRLSPGVRLAELAADTGYFDQAHLARDFHDFAGCSPSQWLADEIGFVQARDLNVDQDRRHDRQQDSATAGVALAEGP